MLVDGWWFDRTVQCCKIHRSVLYTENPHKLCWEDSRNLFRSLKQEIYITWQETAISDASRKKTFAKNAKFCELFFRNFAFSRDNEFWKKEAKRMQYWDILLILFSTNVSRNFCKRFPYLQTILNISVGRRSKQRIKS